MKQELSYQTHDWAHIKARVLAYLIDFAIGLAAIVVASILLSKRAEHPLSILVVVFSIGEVLCVLLYQSILLASTGQTIGKKAMGLRVVNNSGSGNPGFFRSVVLRWWLPILIAPASYLGAAICVFDCMFIFRRNHRCLHDLIAGTKVIRVKVAEDISDR
jgi:uncharacterized RDD family membrane protein YckC